MDLEYRQENMEYWEAVSRLDVEREESGEMIVPDTCPDVDRILVAHPKLLLQRKEAGDGWAEFSGLIRVGILYQHQSEGKTGLSSMEITLPFSAAAEDAALSPDCVLWVKPRILGADVHLLNTRKVLVKVIYSLEVTAYASRTESFLSLIEDPLAWGIRQKTGTLRSFLPAGIQEKAFTVREVQVLPAGEPDPAEILFSDGWVQCREARVVGDKLLFKGEITVELFCRDTRGKHSPVRFQLPFSQVMDGESDGEVCRAELYLTDLSCIQDPEDPRSFHLEAAVQAIGEVDQIIEAPVLSDLYSTSHMLEIDREEVPVADLVEQDEAQETIRVSLPWPAGITGGTCEDLRIWMGRPTLRQEGQDLLLEQELNISALCEGEEDHWGLEKTAAVEHRLTGGEGEHCLWTAALSRDAASSPTPEGLELTIPLTFRWLRLDRGACPVIRRVTLGERLERGEDTPSLIIRAVGEGQTLWDLARTYCSTQEDIMAASGLTDETLWPGQMLLIPRQAG